MRARSPYRICVVCSGNICRSPMGDVVLRALFEQAGLGERVVVTSAGTGAWHEGDGADRRAVRALAAGGYDGSRHRAQQFLESWYDDLDLILAADRGHLRELTRGARRELGEDWADRVEIRLLREFDPAAVAAGELEVDDPYYGGPADFQRALTEVEAACRGVVDHVRTILTP